MVADVSPALTAGKKVNVQQIITGIPTTFPQNTVVLNIKTTRKKKNKKEERRKKKRNTTSALAQYFTESLEDFSCKGSERFLLCAQAARHSKTHQ